MFEIARIVHEEVEAAELRSDAIPGGGDGGGVGDVELDRGGSGADLRRGCLATSQIARSDEHGDTVRDQFFGDPLADSLVGSGHEGDAVRRHGAVLTRR